VWHDAASYGRRLGPSCSGLWHAGQSQNWGTFCIKAASNGGRVFLIFSLSWDFSNKDCLNHCQNAVKEMWITAVNCGLVQGGYILDWNYIQNNSCPALLNTNPGCLLAYIFSYRISVTSNVIFASHNYQYRPWVEPFYFQWLTR
jgi:hypothetical protein